MCSLSVYHGVIKSSRITRKGSISWRSQRQLTPDRFSGDAIHLACKASENVIFLLEELVFCLSTFLNNVLSCSRHVFYLSVCLSSGVTFWTASAPIELVHTPIGRWWLFESTKFRNLALKITISVRKCSFFHWNHAHVGTFARKNKK